MNAVTDAILQGMTRRLVAEFQPKQVFLFGSHAWGQPNEDSDVDLLVIVPHSDKSPLERGIQARYCLRGMNVPKDILVETQAELEKASRVYATLERLILEKGVKLYGGSNC